MTFFLHCWNSSTSSLFSQTKKKINVLKFGIKINFILNYNKLLTCALLRVKMFLLEKWEHIFLLSFLKKNHYHKSKSSYIFCLVQMYFSVTKLMFYHKIIFFILKNKANLYKAQNKSWKMKLRLATTFKIQWI